MKKMRNHIKDITSNVKKHVERDSRNQKHLISTYEGRHNHERPNPRKQYIDDEEDEELAAVDAANTLLNFGSPGTMNFAEPGVHTLQLLHNHTNPEFFNMFIRPNPFGSFNYNMHYSSFLNNVTTMPYARYVPPPFNMMPFSFGGFSQDWMHANGSTSVFRYRDRSWH
ncbi:hypothetical protein DEO72_LG9g2527 [Vigna unguiculata]|uniref:WRKY domain-containing protein n=1 Tax=Vigna unguiculata TaxID=3917 RepID=A0A4D6N6A3_VIGUN|nr:hypothetical protein DEO72_LG9g2527 [Vigna unguiculata]